MSRQLSINELPALPPSPIRDKASALYLIELREEVSRKKQTGMLLRDQFTGIPGTAVRPAKLRRRTA